jgi:hypothetical protein
VTHTWGPLLAYEYSGVPSSNGAPERDDETFGAWGVFVSVARPVAVAAAKGERVRRGGFKAGERDRINSGDGYGERDQRARDKRERPGRQRLHRTAGCYPDPAPVVSARLPALGYSKALEYKYRVKTVALGTLKRYSIFSLTLYLE